MGPVFMTCMARQKTIFSTVVDIGYYPATILAKNKLSVARIPIMRAKKFTIYSKQSMPTSQHELAFRVPCFLAQIISTDP
jgi:hypothetical protein